MADKQQAASVLEKAEELDVKFIRLQFTDILGVLKNVTITVERLEEALSNGVMFDGSSIEGFTRIQESDMYLVPDPATFGLFPWRPRRGAEARLICDVYSANGEPFVGCPRGVLKRAIQKARSLGYEMYAGPEPEFFLFDTDEGGNPTTSSHDKGSYFDLSPVDLGEDARRDIVLALEEMGFEVEASHHEVAPGQHEIDFKYTDVLRTADNISTFRLVTKVIAKKHGLHATFMPKPLYGESGSGMHVHQSLFRDGENAFYDPNGEARLSQEAYWYIGGLLKHAPAYTAITNPTVNSYKRLVPGFEAPVYITWSHQNRSALIRVPVARGQATRLELRNPDPTANPYLALAVMLRAGIDGIENKIEPGPPVTSNVYDMENAEREESGIRSLPGNLFEAVEKAKRSELVADTLGPHVFEHFIQGKTIEWQIYRSQVHRWELEQYLQTF